MMGRALILAAAFAVLSAAAARAAPKAELWARWQAHDPASQRTVDHSPWQAFLDAYLVRDRDEISRVRYGAVTDADRTALGRYITGLARVRVNSLNRDVQRAFWINLYNALTVDVVLDHYPVESIRDIDISPGWFSRGPWGKKLVRIEGAAVSLDDIEHRILRPIWKDNRIHYVLSCAALGCPELLPTAFTSANAHLLLTSAARRFVNHPRAVRIRRGRLLVSSLYFWYREDFGGTDAAILSHISSHARRALKLRLERETTFADGGYDWALNDAP